MSDVKKILLGALGYVSTYRNTLVKVLAIPFLLYLLIDIAELYVQGNLSFVLLSIASVAVNTIMAVSTHRVILIGPEDVTPMSAFNWSNRETRFVAYGILMGVMLVVVMLPLLLIPQVGGFIALPIVAWLVARLSLIFPAIAVDENVSLSKAWELSREHQLLMVLVVVVIPVLFYLPAMLIAQIPYSSVIVSLVSTLALVLTIALLSVAYKYIRESKPEQFT